MQTLQNFVTKQFLRKNSRDAICDVRGASEVSLIVGVQHNFRQYFKNKQRNLYRIPLDDNMR